MRYDVIIGMEVHVQVRTASKMFCTCPNAFGAPPNTNVCPVCLGYPGVLPTPNEEAIRKTIVAGLMAGCDIAPYSKFDRKAYWYPDMPKNYQLSQYDLPFCLNGAIPIGGKGLTGTVEPRDVRLTRIHLEEDVGKSTHFGRHSGVDFNRAGVPLMELVSEPDIHSADEGYLYLVALRQIMQYAGVSDCDMEKGQMRCEPNISVRPHGQEAFNPKTEIKNLNSMKAVHHAIGFEVERQIDALEDGETLRQQTRGWDDAKGQTFVMRDKEEAHDYRYFPDPDLMPIQISTARLDEIRAQLPEGPRARRRRFTDKFGLCDYDAGVLCQDKALADYYEETVAAGADAKRAANWVMTEVLRELSHRAIAITDFALRPDRLAGLIAQIDNGVINDKIAKTVFAEMVTSPKTAADIVKEKGLEQVTDDSAIDEFVQQAIAENPDAVAEFREGKEKALNYLVGQVMRFSRGKANPKMAADALRQALS